MLVSYIGQQSDADKFRYKFKLEYKEKTCRMMVEGKPVAIRCKVTADQYERLDFDMNSAKQFIINNHLPIKFEIIEISSIINSNNK